MPLPKPIRIEKRMIHGELVEVKVYAQVSLGPEEQNVRPRLRSNKGSASRCSG